MGRGVAWAILAGNVLEAVVAEAAQGRLVDMINAAAGVLLILSQPAPGGMRVAPRDAGGDFRYPLGLWIAAYTLWNFTFLYGRESPGGIGASAGFGVIHLVAPLIAMRGDSELWIQARGFALTVLVAVHVGLPHPPFDYSLELPSVGTPPRSPWCCASPASRSRRPRRRGGPSRAPSCVPPRRLPREPLENGQVTRTLAPAPRSRPELALPCPLHGSRTREASCPY